MLMMMEYVLTSGALVTVVAWLFLRRMKGPPGRRRRPTGMALILFFAALGLFELWAVNRNLERGWLNYKGVTIRRDIDANRFWLANGMLYLGGILTSAASIIAARLRLKRKSPTEGPG